MDVIGVLVAGVIIGLLGKLIAPGDKDNTPIWLTILCGIGGVLVGWFIYGAFGGNGCFSGQLAALLRPGEDERAIAWGKAIRLAQRFSGGTEALLRRSSLALSARRVVLTVQPRYRNLASGAVERRLAQLAKALGRSSAIAFG